MSAAATRLQGEPDLARIQEQRAHGLRAFLVQRRLDSQAVADAIEERVGCQRHLLFTSSPVHGLANAKSDIDLITVVDEAQRGPRMATQLFLDDHHLENTSFGTDEVDAALRELQSLALGDAGAGVEQLRAWDAEHELRRKYLERLVNGVTPDFEMPYVEAIPPLAVAWMWSSLDLAGRAATFAALAEAAGETRGRLGYAVDAALHLMDSVLSWHGDVYSNKKWYLLRWRRRSFDPPPLDDRATRPVTELTSAIARIPRVGLGATCIRAAQAVAATLDAPLRPAAALRPVPGIRRMPLLKGSSAIVGPGGECAIVCDGYDRIEIVDGEVALEGLDSTAAADMLRLARAGLVEVEVW